MSFDLDEHINREAQRRIRNAALEEAAKIADTNMDLYTAYAERHAVTDLPKSEAMLSHRATCWDLAKHIRALKESA